jgi:hypothetical protein
MYKTEQAMTPVGSDAVRIGQHVLRVVTLTMRQAGDEPWDASFEVCLTRDGRHYVWLACARDRDEQRWNALLLWSSGQEYRTSLSERELVEFVDQLVSSYRVHSVTAEEAARAFDKHFAAWWRSNGEQRPGEPGSIRPAGALAQPPSPWRTAPG